MLTSSVVILTIGVTLCQSLTINNFRKDLLCDLTERISKGCSREVATDLNLIQCVTLCGRNDSCIGASLDGNGKCFLHQECHDVRFCMTEDTGHHYMSKYCRTWNPSTHSCTMCIHPSCIHAQTCTELMSRGYTSDGDQTVDPDGPGETTQNPVTVYCDMTSRGGVGVSVIGHNRQESSSVNHFEDPLSYKAVLIYNMSFQQAISLVDKSEQCSQYIRVDCYNAGMDLIPGINRYTAWLNRAMQLTSYFGGAPPESYKCKCGVTGTCDIPSHWCNCNINDETWRTDDGYLTYKDDLPIYSFEAGDTGHYTEYLNYQIGALHCWGSV